MMALALFPALVFNGRRTPINASSDVITTKRNVRDRDFKANP